MDEDEIKPVVWVGDAREQVQAFPREVRQDIGSALFDVQKGVKPPQAKPFKGVASGVLEIVTHFETNTYPTVHAVKIGNGCLCPLYLLYILSEKVAQGP
jgi:phage-related protein